MYIYTYKTFKREWFWVLEVMIGEYISKAAGNFAMGTTAIGIHSYEIYIKADLQNIKKSYN